MELIQYLASYDVWVIVRADEFLTGSPSDRLHAVYSVNREKPTNYSDLGPLHGIYFYAFFYTINENM